MLKSNSMKVNIVVTGFENLLEIDSIGKKTVPLEIELSNVTLKSGFNAKSFRRSQATYKELMALGDPIAVVVSGNLIYSNRTLDGAGFQIYQKKPKEVLPETTETHAEETSDELTVGVLSVTPEVEESTVPTVVVEEKSPETTAVEIQEETAQASIPVVSPPPPLVLPAPLVFERQKPPPPSQPIQEDIGFDVFKKPLSKPLAKSLHNEPVVPFFPPKKTKGGPNLSVPIAYKKKRTINLSEIEKEALGKSEKLSDTEETKTE
jgi:hypothetical protein